MARIVSLALALIGVMSLAPAASGRAVEQAPTVATEPLAALLVEVRALRVAIERSVAVTPRIQLAIARLQFEEQRVGQLSTQVDRVRQDLLNAGRERQRLADTAASIEKSLATRTDEQERRSLSMEQAEIQRRIKAQNEIEQQLRARENEAMQMLSTEQNRWLDLNARLDELERLLGPAK